jgi:hypothetical protein
MFSFQFFWKSTVAFLFIFEKLCPLIKIHLDIYRQTMQLVIFLPTFNAPYIYRHMRCGGESWKLFCILEWTKQGRCHKRLTTARISCHKLCHPLVCSKSCFLIL